MTLARTFPCALSPSPRLTPRLLLTRRHHSELHHCQGPDGRARPVDHRCVERRPDHTALPARVMPAMFLPVGDFATRCRLRLRLAVNGRYRARHRARESLWRGEMTRADITSSELDRMARRWAEMTRA